MKKALVVIAMIFTLPIISMVGKFIMDAITENATYASSGGTNITGAVPWLVPYIKSFWWLAPALIILAIFLYVMKREEPTMPQLPSFRPPRQPKPTKKQLRDEKRNQPRPPVFLGR
jgi:hypothetical protein